jgi:hypothetical protein
VDLYVVWGECGMDEKNLFKKRDEYYKKHPELLEIIQKFRIDKTSYYMSIEAIQGKKQITNASYSNRTY